MDDPLVALLASYELFQGLTTEQLHAVRDAGVIHKYKPGTFIVRQGDEITCIYLMFCGSAKLTHITPDGRRALHRFVQSGNGYGVAAVLGNIDFSWSVQAIDNCSVLVWRGEDMIRLMERYTLMMFNVLRLVILRRRDLEDRYMELLTLSVEQRLARALLRLCSDIGMEAPDGCLIDVSLSRGDLAEYTGTTVYSVSRMLQKWDRQGWVSTVRDRVTVRDKKSLEELSGSID